MYKEAYLGDWVEYRVERWDRGWYEFRVSDEKRRGEGDVRAFVRIDRD
jgi:hypothetical protein